MSIRIYKTSATTLSQPALTFGQQGTLKHSKSIVLIAWSTDGHYLAITSTNKTVIIWKVDGSS
jgi:WD40 repeat protein